MDDTDINSLKSQVKMKLEGELSKLASFPITCCIYRIPKILRNVNTEAYTPQAISIGPYHYGKKNLYSMQFCKMRYLQSFLKRTNKKLETYIEMAELWEGKFRECYDENIDLPLDEMVQMILLDGIFIVELLLRIAEGRYRDDEIFSKESLRDDVIHDLILLENQLPFFVLKGLYNAFSEDDNDFIISLYNFCFQYLSPAGYVETKLRKRSFILLQMNEVYTNQTKHLLDLFYVLCVAKFGERSLGIPDDGKKLGKRKGNIELSCSATELQEARVRIEATVGKTDIQFSNIWLTREGVLQIRPLMVNTHTESLFRNILAYEHCHRNGHEFRSYVILMDSLINTPKDVDLLMELGIIKNSLGESEHVSNLFNNLYKITLMHSNDFCYASVCKELNKYSRDPWHRLKAGWSRAKETLRRDYFGSPWTVFSLIAAIILLSLTIIQTVCAIKSTKW